MGPRVEDRKSRIGRLLSLAAAGLLLVAPAAWAQATVTILHFNDVYEITPVDAGKAGGLARLARFRAGLKAQHPELITMLGGDYLSPSALGTARVNGERLAGRQMVAVLNLVGLDWATFGNHEFDIPEAALRARLAESQFRMVSSNVTDASGALFPNTVRHAVIPVRTPAALVRVGLLGLTIDANQQAWVRYAPPIASARAAVAALKGQCDVIVALTHLALAGDQELAEQVPEIDVILGGHEHENWVIERGARYTPIIKADANVRTVAVVDLTIDRRRHRVAVTSRLLPITDSIAEDPSVAAVAKDWTERAFQGFRSLGFEPAAVVTRAPEALDGRESAVRNQPTNLTSLIARGLRAEAPGADLAFFNGGSIRIDDVLPPGPISQYDVIRILPFGGKVVEFEIKGSLLRRVLDQGVANRGSGGFLQVDNVRRTDAGWLVGDTPLDPARAYRAVTIDFLLSGREQGLDYLTATNPDVKVVRELRDVRMSLIDQLGRQYPVR